MLRTREIDPNYRYDSLVGTRSHLPLTMETHSVLYNYRGMFSAVDDPKGGWVFLTTPAKSNILDRLRLKKGKNISPFKLPQQSDRSLLYALAPEDISAIQIGKSTIRFGEREGVLHMIGPQGQFIDLPPNMPVGIGNNLPIIPPGAGRLEIPDESFSGPLHAVIMTAKDPNTFKQMILVENIDPNLFDITFLSPYGTVSEMRRNEQRPFQQFRKTAITSHSSVFKPLKPNPANIYSNHDFGRVSDKVMVVTDGIGLAKGSDIAARTVGDGLFQAAIDHSPAFIPQSFPAIITQLNTNLSDENLETQRGATYALASIWRDEVTVLWGGDVRVYHYHKKDASVNRVTLDDSIMLHDFMRFYLNQYPKDTEHARYLALTLAEDITQHAYDPAHSPSEAIEKSRAIMRAHGISESDMQMIIPARLSPDKSINIPWSCDDLYRRRNLVSKYISGTEAQEPNTAKILVDRGDEIYLLTDGVYRGLTIDEISHIARRKISVRNKSEALVKTSEKRKLRRDEKLTGISRRLMQRISQALDPALDLAQDDDRTAAIARIGY